MWWIKIRLYGELCDGGVWVRGDGGNDEGVRRAFESGDEESVGGGGGCVCDGGGVMCVVVVGENWDEVMFVLGIMIVGGDEDDLRCVSVVVGKVGEFVGTDEGAFVFVRFDLFDDEFFVFFVVFVDVDVDGGVDVVVVVYVVFVLLFVGDEGLLVSLEFSRRRGRRGSVFVV